MNNKLLLEPHSAPDIFWRSLQFFSLYRLAVSLMFFAAVIVSGDVLSVGIEDPTLFVRSAILYVIAAMAFLAAVRHQLRLPSKAHQYRSFDHHLRTSSA